MDRLTVCVSVVRYSFRPCFIRCSCSSSSTKIRFQNWYCSSNLIKRDTDISLLQLKICFVNVFFPAPLWYTIMGVLIKTNATFQVLHWLIQRHLRANAILCQVTRWVSTFDETKLASDLMLAESLLMFLSSSSFYLIAFHFHFPFKRSKQQQQYCSCTQCLCST